MTKRTKCDHPSCQHYATITISLPLVEAMIFNVPAVQRYCAKHAIPS